MRYTCAQCKTEIPDGSEHTAPIGMDGLAATYHGGCLPGRDKTVNVFTDGIPLESLSPDAHQEILTSARYLSRAMIEGSTGDHCGPDMIAADWSVRRAARLLHEATQTGRQTVWLQVVRYAVELHAARLVAENRLIGA